MRGCECLTDSKTQLPMTSYSGSSLSRAGCLCAVPFVTHTMELCSSYLYVIHKAIVLFALVSCNPMGIVEIGVHLTWADSDLSSNNNTVASRIINACDSHLLDIGQNSSGTITLQSGHNACSIFLVGPAGQSILLAFEEVDSATFHYMFVERHDPLLSPTCSGRFAVFTNNPNNCSTIFSYNRLQLHLQGRVTLQLQPSISNDSLQHCPGTSQCHSTCLQVPGTCSDVLQYHHIGYCAAVHHSQLTLNQVKNVTKCYFYCPRECHCTLSKHEMTADCLSQKTIKTFILYPEEPTGLYLGDKRIYALDEDAFAGLEGLQELSLSNNSLTEVTSGVFGNLRYMKWLDLSHNHLQRLQPGLFHGLTSLDFLNLGHNRLSNLQPRTFGDLLSLDSLFLNNNHFKKLKAGVFQGLQSLKWLNLESNNLTDLPVHVLNGLKALQTLKLGDNNLARLRTNMFRALYKLTVLELQKNRLHELKPHDFGSLPGLAILNLEKNHLKKIHRDAFQDLNNLLSLSLSNNYLSDLEPGLFSHLGRLHWLNLDANNLTDIKPGTFWGLPFVQIILLQHNNITVLQPGAFEGIPNLHTLNMSHNSLYDINTGTFKELGNLERIFLNNNNLTLLHTGMFDGLANLERLYLVRNRIRDIEPGVFDGLSSLHILYLEGNAIEELQAGVFNGLPNLNIIQLTNNQLSSLSKGVFHDIYMLHYLNLENNSLQRLEADFCEDCDSLETLNLIGNALQWVKMTSFSGLTNSTQILVDDHATCCFTEMANCTAQNQKPVFLTCERLLPKPILRIFMWILGLCALCGNAFVLYCRLSQRRERSKVQSQLIIHLSFSDLLMGVYMIILTSADVHFGVYFPSHANAWRGGQTCQLASVLSVLSSEASVFFITLISIDRLLGVKYPFSSFRFNLKSTKIVTSVLWLVALTLSTIPLLLSRINSDIYDVSEVCIGLPMARKSVTESKNKSVLLSRFYTKRIQVEVTEKLDTEPGMYYSIAMFIGLNLLCFCVVAFCYMQIFITVKRSSRKVGRHREREEEIRMASKMALIVLTDFFCWMPVIITGILVQSGAIEISPVMYAWMVTFVLPINSSVNPFMYTIATVMSDRFPRKKPPHRMSSVMIYSQGQKTMHRSSSDSGPVQVKYKDISSQVTTDETNKTSVEMS